MPLPLEPDDPRHLRGDGRDVPHARWPSGARIAVQFVLNDEEGGENSVLHGDRASEQFQSEIVGAAAYEDRHLSVGSIYEYGGTADHVHSYLRDSFDARYAEGDPDGLDRPQMMSVGMHCRLLGRPGRIVALQRFIDHVASHDDAWVCRRVDIARHWAATHPFGGTG